MAFKVFNNLEAEAEAARQARLQQKVALQPAANTGTGEKPNSGPKNAPPGACFKCSKEGHWARQCPQPRPQRSPAPIADSLATGGMPVPLEALPWLLHAGDQPIKVWTLPWLRRNFSDS